MSNRRLSASNYLRGLKPPFCPGCGCFTVTSCFLRAVHDLGHDDFNGFVFCSGIGCGAWIPSPYFKADSIHTTHGRSIPVATGVKMVRPDLNVVVFGGDGDLAGIGLSHLVHAARRNLDITVIMINNMIYGMTGGQVAPTTPLGTRTATTPYGSFEYPLDVARITTTAGASYSARWTASHIQPLRESMKKALTCGGFGFIEVLIQCPTAYGRRVGFKTAKTLLQWLKESSISHDKAEKMSEGQLKGKIVVGEFAQRRYPSLTENIRAMNTRVTSL